MSKTSHLIKVWAVRHGWRTLEFNVDAPDARRRAMACVKSLQGDPTVEEVQMREHIVIVDDEEQTHARRRSLRWVRAGTHWCRMPDSNARTHGHEAMRVVP